MIFPGLIEKLLLSDLNPGSIRLNHMLERNLIGAGGNAFLQSAWNVLAAEALPDAGDAGFPQNFDVPSCETSMECRSGGFPDSLDGF